MLWSEAKNMKNTPYVFEYYSVKYIMSKVKIKKLSQYIFFKNKLIEKENK